MIAAQREANRKPLRILVVEDNIDQVHTLVYLLRDMGHEVDFAINGIVAWDLAQRSRPDVLVLDVALPDVSGYDLLAKIRAHSQLARLHAIAVTGLPISRAEALARGFNDFVSKPIEFRFLEAALQRRESAGAPAPGE